MKRTLVCLLLSTFMLGSVFTSNNVYASVTLPTDSTTVASSEIMNSALREFHSLSKQDRKARIKEARAAFKDMRKEGLNSTSAVGSTPQWVLVILAILLPPLAVYLHQGEINNKFWISLVLTLLFFIPGVIYSLLVVLGAA